MSRARRVAATATLDIGFPSGCGEYMNNPEVTMNNALPKNNFIATEKAIKAAAEAISVVRRVPDPLKSIADQVIRSASSVPGNLAEGHGRSGRDRFHHWRIAYVSAKEVDTHLRLLTASRTIESTRAHNAIRLFDEVRAMTWRLLNP